MPAVFSKYNGACTYLIVAPTLTPYVGQTVEFQDRMKGHKSDGKLAQIRHAKWLADKNLKKVCAISHAIHKYGWENMRIIILEKYSEWDQQLLDEREKHFIRFYDSFKNGYNCNEGGNGGGPTHHTEETKAKISAKLMGHTNSPTKPVTSCLIKQEYADGTQLVEFVSYAGTRDAARQTGTNYRHISKCCLKKKKSAGGFLWFFTEENHPPQIIWVGEHIVAHIGDKPTICLRRKVFSESPSGEKQLHESQLAAGRDLSTPKKKFCYTAISRCCNGNRLHHHGYKFYWASDEEVEDFEKEQEAAVSKKRKRNITDYFN